MSLTMMELSIRKRIRVFVGYALNSELKINRFITVWKQEHAKLQEACYMRPCHLSVNLKLSGVHQVKKCSVTFSGNECNAKF